MTKSNQTIFKVSIMNKLSSILSLAFFVAIFFGSCENKETIQPIETGFEEFSMNYYESVSGYYPEGDVIMKMESNKLGEERAVIELTGKSKEYVEWGSFVGNERTSADDGTDCDGAMSCGKALKKCLDGGLKGVIANGLCASYCVTCE
ncbi:MAG: hypothetical protein ACJAWV_000619 [Flammeovirgaceae bacterium]